MKIISMQVAPLGTNCYLLCDEETKLCAVIDPGGEPQRIAGAMARDGYTPCAIFLTHGHYDHTGAVAGLRELFPEVAVYMNRRDSELMGRNIPGAMAAQLFQPLPGEILDYDQGDEIAVGELTVTVLATPGHSLGSVSLKCGRALFTGDTLFAGSCGRTDLYGGSMTTTFQSLRKLAELEGNYTVLPGHMEPTDLDTERATNYYMTMAMRG